MIQRLQKVISVLLLTAVFGIGFIAPSYAIDIALGVKSGTFEVPANNEQGAVGVINPGKSFTFVFNDRPTFSRPKTFVSAKE